MNRAIFINSAILSFGILLGRLSGYIRELIIAFKFDVSSDADTIILILTIPDLLNNLIAAGAISGILLPILSESKSRNEMAAVLSEFTMKLLRISIVLYVIIAGVLMVLYQNELALLLIISLASIFPNILTFVSTSYLQFKKRFKAISLNTLIFNLVIIVFIFFGFINYVFATGVIIASILRVLWVTYDVRNTDITINAFFKTNYDRKIKYGLIIFMLFANGIIFILPMIDKMFASFMSEGSLAILSYAEKIYLLPVSVFLTTYAVAMFPDMSILVAENKNNEIKSLLKRAIGFNLIISLGTAVFVFILSHFLVNLFFGFSNITSENISIIAETLQGYCIAIVVAGSNSIVLNLFFARKWYDVLIYYSTSILLLKMMLNASIVYLGYNVKYIPYGTSLILVVSFLTLLLIYYFKSKKIK